MTQRRVKTVGLTPTERERYRRQIMIPGLGEKGQQRLKKSSVLVTRVGGLGGPTALFLAAAGVGRLVMAHGGELEMADLNRQILMEAAGVGRPRIAQAVKAVQRLSPDVDITGVGENMTPKIANRLVAGVDLVIAAPPTFEERFALNDACFRHGKPMVEASMNGMDFYLTTFMPGRTGCLRCLYPEFPADWKVPFPVLGAVSGAAGCLAATEAIKVLAGLGEPLHNRLLVFDCLAMRSRVYNIRRLPACAVCAGGGRP